VASGEWRVASGEWRVASGEWRVASGELMAFINFAERTRLGFRHIYHHRDKRAMTITRGQGIGDK